MIRIEPTDANTYLVNNKEVYQDLNNNWMCKEELTQVEKKAWKNYKAVAIDGKRENLTLTTKA